MLRFQSVLDFFFLVCIVEALDHIEHHHSLSVCVCVCVCVCARVCVCVCVCACKAIVLRHCLLFFSLCSLVNPTDGGSH